ncbi:N-(5'-phosphoribosyl)anthranilate isomerase [Heliobacillus mobilis]|uniref:N-(5'-phosphoribosyl)anthranilate isomerase n=1 Tax=Heliobacterium mobile TaxID=28064 RepID=A0A6I3SAY7_HELMO|nr:phosphoribosylanthranilate isomerase [Heliobacterium mobile]MTV47428.1 N-(5'-phosphoribosyl)anthranilate isomerase [Heliobacterium mobile]
MPSYPRVKICGIRSHEDAQVTVAAGTHAIAFNFVRGSRRYIDPELAREIALALPPFISIVGVFADEPRYSVEEIASLCRLHVLQFHGGESPEYCRRWSYPIIKAFRFRDEVLTRESQNENSIQEHPLGEKSVNGNSNSQVEKVTTVFDNWEQLSQAALSYEVSAFLVDAYCPTALGGMGKAFDWSKIEGSLHRPMILAGGLNPENVREAIMRIRPYGVDVASGVEKDGKKDWEKSAAFVEAARCRID